MPSEIHTKRYIIAGLVILAIIAVGGWFWSLGSIVPDELPQIQLTVDHDGVLVKQTTSADWQIVTKSTPLHAGDEIKTDATGFATITWSDRGVTRIDSNSDIVIDNMPDHPAALTQRGAQLHLISGRAWTRLLKLFDLDGQTSVRTDSVIATVRGTSFGVNAAKDGTEVAVHESVVDVTSATSSAPGTPTILTEGHWGKFDPATARPKTTRVLQESDTWALENNLRDARHEADLQKQEKNRLDKQSSPAPQILARLSERLHLMLVGGQKRDELEQTYLVRHIADALLSPRATSFDSAVLTRLGNASPTSRTALLRALQDAINYRVRITEDNADATLVSLQSIRSSILNTSPVTKLYAEILDRDDNIDQLFAHRDQTSRVNQSALLARVEELGTRVRAIPPSPQQERLVRKYNAVRARLEGIGIDVTTQATLILTPSATTSTAPTTPTATTSTPAPTPTSPTPKPVVSACNYTNPKLMAFPSNIATQGQPITLNMFVTCNAKVIEVTADATFTTGLRIDGSMNKNIFTPSRTGSITVRGAVIHNGRTSSATMTLTVPLPTIAMPTIAVPTKVTITTPGSTKLGLGQSVPLEATATYSNNTQKLVTSQCAWSTTDARLGFVSNNRFTAASTAGQVGVMCRYTDAGASVVSTLLFTIVAPNTATMLQ